MKTVNQSINLYLLNSAQKQRQQMHKVGFLITPWAGQQGSKNGTNSCPRYL